MGGVRTILLIEDDLNVYHGLQRKLKASNYETLYAPDAVASISQARQHHPDLILLDLGLPAGDGFVVMNRLRQFPELSMIPVIVLSGRDRLANESRALLAGATAFLQKPVNSTLLLETIARCLSKRERRADGPTYSLEAEEAAVKTYTFGG
jgi:DNA-binding response OmpR family regulator